MRENHLRRRLLGDLIVRRISSDGVYEKQIGYCRAVVAGDWIFISGTTAQPDPITGCLDDDVVIQCKNALERIGAALAEAGADFSNVVRVTYMLPHAADFPACFETLRRTFGTAPPTATMIECALIDPKYLIEIEVTAYVGK